MHHIIKYFVWDDHRGFTTLGLMDDADLQAKLEKLTAEVEREASAKPAFSRAEGQKPTPRDRPGGMVALWKGKFLLPLVILAIPWTQEILDQVFFRGRWNFVLHPRTIEGIPGIFLSAFSHANFAHLIGNSLAFALFSWLVLAKSRKDFWITLGIGWLGGGLVSWLLGPQSVHGLSGVVYTLFGYLLVIGWLEKRVVSLLISVLVLINYSSFIWGVFPTQPMVAWWGHLFGLLLGVLAAFCVYREPKGGGA